MTARPAPSDSRPLGASSVSAAAGTARAPAAAVAWGVVGLFAAVAGWLGWRSLGWPLVHDAPIMHYIAWRIGEGAVPYRDLFDMNFPGVYLVHLGVLATLGAGDAGWRAFDLAWLAAGSGAVAALAAPWGAPAAAGGALFFAVHHLAGGAWQAGQRDFLLCPFLLAGVLGVARWLERRRPASLAWGGLALGAGITIKPHALALAAALAVVVAVAARRTGVAGPLAAFALPLALAPLAVVAWVAALGGLPAWRAIVVDYLVPLYSRLGRPARWGFHRWHVWIPVAVAAGASLASAGLGRRLSPRHGLAALGVVYGVAHYVGQGKGWEYHVYPLAAFAAPLLFSEVAALLRSPRPVAGALVAASLGAVALMLAAKGAEAAAAADDGWIAGTERRVAAVVADLRPRLAPGDLVQMLDTTDGGIHALLRLGVAQPTRFVYDFHFFHDVDAPVIAGLRRELVGGLERRPPRFVVLFRRGWPAGGYERLESFPALRDRLAAAYRVEVRGDGYVIHAKRDDP